MLTNHAYRHKSTGEIWVVLYASSEFGYPSGKPAAEIGKPGLSYIMFPWDWEPEGTWKSPCM
jgi:hypothetical protein